MVAESLLCELASHFDYLPAWENDLRCRMWRDATEAYISSERNRSLDSLGVAVLEFSAARVLLKSASIIEVLIDWSCGNTYDADLALFQLLGAWHDLCEWQLNRWGGVDLRWKEIYMYNIQLVGVAATRMAARSIVDLQNSDSDVRGEMLEYWSFTRGQAELNKMWKNRYKVFKNVASRVIWWARVVEDRQHVPGWGE